MNVNTQLSDSAVHRAAMLRPHELNLHKGIDETLGKHRDELVDMVAKGAKGEALDKQSSKTFGRLLSDSANSLLTLANDQLSFTFQSFETAMSSIWVSQRPRRIDETFILKEPLIANRNLEEDWAAVAKGDRLRIEQVIRKGISERKTEAEIALDVRRSNLHNITRNQSKTLVTTAMTSVVAQADHSVYEANEGALDGWQYISVLDNSTTTICIYRDGKIYKISERQYLPASHRRCRARTTPVVKSWQDLAKLEGVAQVRKRNLEGLSDKQKAFYDGAQAQKESYDSWLRRQPPDVQLTHLGDYKKLEAYRTGQFKVSSFITPQGNPVDIEGVRRMSNGIEHTKRFADAKAKLDAMQIGAVNPDDIVDNPKMAATLRDYYRLQAADLDGTLSLTNYRGNVLSSKMAKKKEVLNSPPTDKQLRFNPITNSYEDSRRFPPIHEALKNQRKLIQDSEDLLPRDKKFLLEFSDSLEGTMSVNERAVVANNLRVMFSKQRRTGESWGSFKAVSNSQMGFDVMNISDYMENQLREKESLLSKLSEDNYIDPVLGKVQLKDLHDNLIDNIRRKNQWEDFQAPKIAKKLRSTFDHSLNPLINIRLTEDAKRQFYLRFAHRLSMADSPDIDGLAVTLGRDLYNSANLNGSKDEWLKQGLAVINNNNSMFEVETYGVQKRRMRSKITGDYFGPYVDTLSKNIRITDKSIQEYSRLNRKVELGMRVGDVDTEPRLFIKEGRKTYFAKHLGLAFDTRIPVTSTSSFSDFPEEFLDKSLTDALNWAGKAKYRVDPEFYDFTQKLLGFRDDKGEAKRYEELNEYKKHIAGRGDAYERFKAMQWHRETGAAFSNPAFLDHRGRIYDRGLISPQSGETFRPFLNTEKSHILGQDGLRQLNDQIGGFLGGLSGDFEGHHNSLTSSGRQAIAEKWRKDMVDIGDKMRRGKPGDIRAILSSPVVQQVDGEDLGKFLRMSLEQSRIASHKGGVDSYVTSLALEQDASSSGAQIIALTTRNKQLAELSNVVPTNQKRRLYDEIARETFYDPRFIALNEKLGLTEKQLRKAAKAQNMVTFYGAGETTGILNVEGKLAKALNKPGTLVLKTEDRDNLLSEISAQAARYKRTDPELFDEFQVLRKRVSDVFNKGTPPDNELLEDLWFLGSDHRNLVDSMTRNYDKVVTPGDFKLIARIMSDKLGEQVPILKSFTNFFGRLSVEFLENAKPKDAAFDWITIAKGKVIPKPGSRYVLPDIVSQILGLKPGEPVTEKFLKNFSFYSPDSPLSEILNGVKDPKYRRTGAKYLGIDLLELKTVGQVEIFKANKLPKKWTSVPSVNFDGSFVEQHFTQSYETMVTQNVDGETVRNIVRVSDKTDATWWQQVINKDGKINDVADAVKARTAYAVNMNHSNDATIVKKFHLWGKDNDVATSTIHDAFFTNVSEMTKAKDAIRRIYANSLSGNVVVGTLDEMLKRGLPRASYDKFLDEAIASGILPVAGKSLVGGKILKESDILKVSDILGELSGDKDFYGIGP